MKIYRTDQLTAMFATLVNSQRLGNQRMLLERNSISNLSYILIYIFLFPNTQLVATKSARVGELNALQFQTHLVRLSNQMPERKHIYRLVFKHLVITGSFLKKTLL